MSSPAQGGPAVRKKRLSRVLTRVKTVFKKGDGKGSDQAEPSPAAGVVAGPAVAAPAPVPAPAPAPAPVEAEVSTSAPPAETSKNNTMPAELPEGVIKVPRSQIYEERARKLSERYGLEITPSGWHHAEGHVLRVEKPIRMRVHRTCHECGDYFGQTRECPSCKHVRCKECGRRPPKRSESERAESRKRRAALEKERAENPPIIADWDQDGKHEVLRRPSNKPGGQDLVLKRIRQRVRRTCCQCSRMFNSGEKNCPECKHIRCTDCPREPAKKEFYPYGYPGDVFGPKSTPYFECHECKARYPPNPPDGAECAKCGHLRCDDCPRLTPRKIEPEPDPEVWKSLQEKLGKLALKDK